MQQQTHNQTAPKMRRRPSLAIVSLLVLQLVMPASVFARPATVGEVTSLSSFKMLMVVIANLNRAMEVAAQNPQDDWRRQDAARAFSALPPAIIGLAQDFKAGKLGNEDLPMVQAMLGGFVNKNAGDNFKQFMKAPSKNLIPQVSNQLAPMLPKPNSSSQPGSAQVASKAAPASTSNLAAADSSAPANPQILSLADPGVMNAPASTQTGPTAKDQSQSIGYDEGAGKQKVESGVAATASASAEASQASRNLVSANVEFSTTATSASSATTASGSTQSGSAPVAGPRDAMSELRQVEVNLVTASVANAPVVAVKEDSDKAQFFSKIKVGEDDQASDDEATDTRHTKKQKAGSRRPASVDGARSSLTPKYFNVRPLALFAEHLLIDEAHAEGSNGGGGGGGGKEGGSAAEILYGMAAIMAAAAPIAVASIQAKTDKYIAKTNADAQIQMTTITSDTSKYLADQQKSIALQQADIAQSVNKSNNDYVTQRLQLQLTELSNARHEAEAAEQQKLAIEQQYNNQRIQLAQQQADQNVKLAQQTLNAQLTQLGLTSGAINSRNSGDRLTSSSTFGAPSGGAGSSIGAQVGRVQQTSGLVASRGSSPVGNAASSRTASTTSKDSMSFDSGRGATVNLGSNNFGTYNGGASAGNRGAETGGAAEIPLAASAGPVVAPPAITASGFSGNRGAVASGDSGGGGGDSSPLGSAMRDLATAGDTNGIGGPAPVQELAQGDLSKGNEALLAQVHQPGGENRLLPRKASVNFSDVKTVASARGVRGGVQGRSRLGAARGSKAAGNYGVGESRILSYLRSQASNPRALNGSTPGNHYRIVTERGAIGSDLGLFVQAAGPKEKSAPASFVEYRQAEAEERGTRNRGGERGPASLRGGNGGFSESGSGHKRQ